MNSNFGEMISATVIVSPMARPKPSMTAPMTPPRAYGMTTVRIMPQRVHPSAYAASRSPIGACENTSRARDVVIGMIIRPTTTPAIAADEV